MPWLQRVWKARRLRDFPPYGRGELLPRDVEQTVGRIAAAIDRRVDGLADPSEPIGLLTHHLVHDEAVWIFCESLMEYLARRAMLFLRIQELFRNKGRIVVEQ